MRTLPTIAIMVTFAFMGARGQGYPPSKERAAHVRVGVHVGAAGQNNIENATVKLGGQTCVSDYQGACILELLPGDYSLSISASDYEKFSIRVSISTDMRFDINLQLLNSITIHPEADVLSPDPSTHVLVHGDVLDANPGRPGVPISLPGLPAETASGGVKAPQYFAPGVAGDHGEPIAQYIQVGRFLFANNLSANAHGNGYADPNILIFPVIGSVQVDGGAFNPRYGDHAINLAVGYRLRPRIDSFLQVAGDFRDFDAVLGWSPKNPATNGWLVTEFSFGDGLLARPESREQYKVNGYREYAFGEHELTLFGLGYYGFSRLPGLAPIDVSIPGGTIDPRQQDLTHSSAIVGSDTWSFSGSQQFQFSGFFRTYSLRLLSNFGDGLIRQSEFRTISGGDASYVFKSGSNFSFIAGFDLRQDAVRGLSLDRAESNGPFLPVTSNDLTINSISPFAAISGGVTRWLTYNVGIRRDQFAINNGDRLNPSNSRNEPEDITSPKATVTLAAPEGKYLPIVAFSYGQAFHVNDPRIGTDGERGTAIAKSRAFQIVATEIVAGTEFCITAAHVTNSAELAKIDADTGLQENVGPSLVRSLTISARRQHGFGYLQASFSRANATDRLSREPIPEAPRLIWSVIGTVDRLPLKLRFMGEFEYVGRKPLGDGFTARSVHEIRTSLIRSFGDQRLDVGVNAVHGHGYTGQTVETLLGFGEDHVGQRVVGVPMKSYFSLSLTYYFGK
jgi:hypothetical protein